MFADEAEGQKKLEQAIQATELRRSEAQASAAEAVLAMGRNPAVSSPPPEQVASMSLATTPPAPSTPARQAPPREDLSAVRALVSKRTVELRTLRTLVDTLEPGPTRDAATQAEQLAASALEEALAEERNAIKAAM